MGDFSVLAELAFDEFIVVEIFIRQIERIGTRLFRPAGLFVGTAFRTGFRSAGNFRAASWGKRREAWKVLSS